ncbi:MAG TPA: PHP domain-containing protein [Candidatus Saccharimonadales bacterium]|nr:PHP domain-containing protein [Candidatus Saccharimonadales bacterium]
MTYKIDLHTHSIASPDGGLRMVDYATMISEGRLDFVAITDHNRIDFALEAQRELGDAIIVGEEINTLEGEMIGLFLKEPVPPGLTARETAERIHAQRGLVYIPHPFETVRKGMTDSALYKVAPLVDIIEIYNGRALFQSRSHMSEKWAAQHHCPGASSSDAHGKVGWGNTYSEIGSLPRIGTLAQALRHARYRRELVGLRGIIYPKYNRLRKLLAHA